MAASKKGGLGRGLDALFGDMAPISLREDGAAAETPEADTPEKKKTKSAEKDDSERVRFLSIHDVKPNGNQPRKAFNEEKIEELARSIRENGIIQPIIVRKREKGYEIVAGERRWRAAVKAELKKIPCLIRELDDEQNMLLAIIENMQREDLNPIEEAEGLEQMIKTYGMTQEKISKSVGKSRPYIANSLRLLKLPDDIRELVADGRLSAGHARAILSVEKDPQRKKLAERAVNEGLSVREVEKLAAAGGEAAKKRGTAKPKDPDLARVESSLKEALGTRVNIKRSGKRGKIELEFFSREELERLIELLESLK